MSKAIIIAAVFVMIMILLILKGDRKLKVKEGLVHRITKVENDNAEYLAFLAYHGGFPMISRPQKIHLALAHDGLILFTEKGANGKINFSRCKKVEKFTTKKNPDLKGKSIVLWGPFMAIWLKPKIRHFLFINYQDSVDRNNNVLLEASSIDELELVFSKIQNGFNNSKHADLDKEDKRKWNLQAKQ